MADVRKVKICWETSPFVALFWNEANRADVCQSILDAAKRGDILLYTSTMSLIEAYQPPVGTSASDWEATEERFFRNRWIHKQEPDFFVAKEARRLQREFHLGARDATHLATAIYLQVDILHTYDDDDLISLNGKIPNLVIQHPAPLPNTTIPMTGMPNPAS
ncbi:MAG: PIN domain-containing protein [Chloroflexi bacterium]|nr:PIN domain-containing protein [Chloroflexota bacterium]